MTEQENRTIREALSSCLSGVDALSSMRSDILRAAKGEKKVKRKLSKGLVLALVLILMMSSVAVAAGLGMFGQIGQQEHSDSRLPGLENVSTVLEKAFDVGGGVTVTVHQAYYDGSRVFISYSMTGPHDVLETGVGDPGIVNYDREEQGVIFREQWFVEGPNGQELMDWLDGSEPRWATCTVVNVHDGLQIGETYLDIIGGEYYYLEDGTLMSWKECEVPAELAEDEVTFSIGVFTNKTTHYQTPEALYTSYRERGKTTWHDFTVKKTEASAALTGMAQTADWTAAADLTASAIDVKGEVILECPKAWSDLWQTWENPDKTDYIHDWTLYVNGAEMDGYNLNGGVNVLADGKLRFTICYKLDSLTADMKLVPIYCYAGNKVEEAIPLTAAK